MTERTGRRARWTAAVVVAPGAAALFSGAVSWASHTVPAAQPATPTTAGKPATRVASAQEIRQRAALEKAAGGRAKRAAALRAQLKRLQKQLAAGAGRAGTPGGAASGVPAGSGGGTANSSGASGGSAGSTLPVGSSGTGGGSAAQPAGGVAPVAAPPAAAPPPAAPQPPPVQATTGASTPPVK